MQEELDRRGLGELVMPTLLKLVALGVGDEPTRRRLPRARLSAAENEVIDAFIDAGLAVSDRDGDEPIVAVAHEAMLRSWPPLATAIVDAREDLRRRAQLERAALDWDQAGRHGAYTLAGPRLQAAQTWVQAHPDELPLVQELIAASLASDAGARRRAAETLAQRVHESDPEFGARLAVAAVEEHGPVPALIDALRTALQTSRVQATLRGSDAPLTSVAWAPDGVHAATGAADGTVRVWNTTNGRLVREISGEDSVTDLAFAPDGTEIGIATGTQRSRLVGPDGERPLARSVAWPPETIMYRDPDHVVTGCGPDAVVWEGSAEIEVIRSIGSALALSPQRDRVVAVSKTATDAAIFTLAGGARLVRLENFFNHHARTDVYPSSVAWSADGTRVGAAVEEGGWVWDAHDGHLVSRLLPDEPVAAPRGRPGITSISFSADATRAVTVFRDGVARVWNTAEGRELSRLAEHGAPVTCAVFAPRGTRILTASEDGTARVWDVGHDVQPGIDGLLYQLPGQAAPLSSVAVSPDGTCIAGGATDGRIHVWADGATVLRGHSDEVTALCFSTDGSTLLSASLDGTLRFWPVGGGEPRIITGPNPGGRMAAAGARFTSAAYAPDGARVVAGLRDSTARLWDVVSGDMLGGVAHDGPVTTVAFAPDGDRIATGSGDDIFATGMTGHASGRIWDTNTRQRLQVLEHRTRVLSVAFSPDGGRLATGSEDASARIWDAAGGDELLAIRGHDAAVTSVAFSPDGGRLLTASEDATARVWDIVDGRERFVFAGHGGPVTAATFAPDGSRIATASSDGTVRLWQETGVEELLRAADQRLGERLSADDRRHFGLAERAGPPLTRVADLPSFADVDRDALIAERARSIAVGPDAGSDDENWARAEEQLRDEARLD